MCVLINVASATERTRDDIVEHDELLREIATVLVYSTYLQREGGGGERERESVCVCVCVLCVYLSVHAIVCVCVATLKGSYFLCISYSRYF